MTYSLLNLRREYPTQNMMFSSSNEGVYLKLGETTGSKEITELIVDSETALKLDYDNDLNYELEVYDSYSDLLAKVVLNQLRRSLLLRLMNLHMMMKMSFYGKFKIVEGAKIEDLNTTSQKFDHEYT